MSLDEMPGTPGSQKERMLSGRLYEAWDPELVAGRAKARDLLREINAGIGRDRAARQELFRSLFGAMGKEVGIEPPFFCDYGSNIRLGDGVFFNFNCVILDPAPVVIGDRSLFGPAVQIYTATHPLESGERAKGLEAAKAVAIGSDVWVGGGAIILPGVKIGNRCIIGAGSVVTKDVPEGVFAAGNPCRAIRSVS